MSRTESAKKCLLLLVVMAIATQLFSSFYFTSYYTISPQRRLASIFRFLGRKLKAERKVQTVDSHDNTDSSNLSVTSVSRRFQQRLQLLQQACEKYGNSSLFRPLQPSRGGVGPYWPVMNVSVGYCSIQKTGSTTWHGIFNAIRRKMQNQGIAPSQNVSTKAERNMSFFFVRDPYARLLSAYVDKLFSPNIYFWTLGRYIVRRFRRQPTNHSLSCGHDVTFPEFIRYVIHSQKTGTARNGHFVPTHDHCDVCHVPYQYIGHLETLKDDMPYLLNAMQSPVNYTTNFDKHIIRDNAIWLAEKIKAQLSGCMSRREACQRLWKKWQIRAILSKTRDFPLTEQQADVISMAGFVKLSQEALARSGPKVLRRPQKTEALCEAFASVPLEDKNQLRNLLFLDFALFGFEPSPQTVFPQTRYEPTTNFSYFNLQLR